MSRLISELLGADEPAFSLMIRNLELSSGKESTDIRLFTDISAKVRQKTKELGLDPADSNGRELYYSLISLVKLHDKHLHSAIGATDDTPVNDLLKIISNVPEKLGVSLNCFAIKTSSAKRLLAKKPPRNLMKIMGYRSVDSMLKRANISEIFAGLTVTEAESWLESFRSSYEKLKPSDFETRSIQILVADKKKWEKESVEFIKTHGHNMAVSYEAGVILLLPISLDKLPGLTITVLPLMLEAINEIKMYGAFFKLKQVKGDFGKIVARAVSYDLGASALLSGHPVHFRVVHRHFGSKEDKGQFFEPHLVAEDLNWRKAEDLLYRLEPSLSFWRDIEYVGYIDKDKTVSFNLLDAAVSYLNNLEYGQHSTYHLRAGLWGELFRRYMGNKNLEAEVLSQLDQQILETKHVDLAGISNW